MKTGRGFDGSVCVSEGYRHALVVGTSDALVMGNTSISPRAGLKREQCDLFMRYSKRSQQELADTN